MHKYICKHVHVQYTLYSIYLYCMMTSSNGNIFRFTDPLWGESTGYRWIPLTKSQWRGGLMFSLICTWTKVWANNQDAGDLRRHDAHYDVIVTVCPLLLFLFVWLFVFVVIVAVVTDKRVDLSIPSSLVPFWCITTKMPQSHFSSFKISERLNGHMWGSVCLSLWANGSKFETLH